MIEFPIKEVTGIEMVFGAKIVHLMPTYQDIPAEFKKAGSTKWERLADRWFARGLKGVELYTKEGVDLVKALRHLSTIMNSYEPQHEHKIAAGAYLMSQWFDYVRISE
jgi:hypothetical protein